MAICVIRVRTLPIIICILYFIYSLSTGRYFLSLGSLHSLSKFYDDNNTCFPCKMLCSIKYALSSVRFSLEPYLYVSSSNRIKNDFKCWKLFHFNERNKHSWI